MKTITVSDAFYEKIISEMVDPFIIDLIVNNFTSNGSYNSINKSTAFPEPLSTYEKSSIKIQCLQFALNQSTVLSMSPNDVISKAKLFEQYILGE